MKRASYKVYPYQYVSVGIIFQETAMVSFDTSLPVPLNLRRGMYTFDARSDPNLSNCNKVAITREHDDVMLINIHDITC